jgi:hypothetical protein
VPSVPAPPAKAKEESRLAVPQHVAWRAFPTETVLLNLQTGHYHGLNPSGGRMYEVLDECGDLNTAAERLAKELGQPLEAVTADLRQFCVDLIERGLLEVPAPRR